MCSTWSNLSSIINKKKNYKLQASISLCLKKQDKTGAKLYLQRFAQNVFVQHSGIIQFLKICYLDILSSEEVQKLNRFHLSPQNIVIRRAETSFILLLEWIKNLKKSYNINFPGQKPMKNLHLPNQCTVHKVKKKKTTKMNQGENSLCNS